MHISDEISVQLDSYTDKLDGHDRVNDHQRHPSTRETVGHASEPNKQAAAKHPAQVSAAVS